MGSEARYSHAGVELFCGDCRDVLATLADGSVQCVVTSPPFFNLRDYGTASWEGGDTDCDHSRERAPISERARGKLVGSTTGIDAADDAALAFRDVCGKCGARRIDRQIGLEQTPAAYVAEMVAVFRAVRRVLRDDGTVFLNLGDSYFGGGGYYPDAPSNQPDAAKKRGAPGAQTSGARIKGKGRGGARRQLADGLKPKDLIGIPWRVAFALQADGWWLRSDIVWHKPNPMPESVTDRPTRSHEYIFLLTKNSRYYYGGDAIAEDAAQPFGTPALTAQHKRGMLQSLDSSRLGTNQGAATRNKRDVWTIATAPYPNAHFATFPPKLIEPCILAGCPAGGVVLDPFCGAGTTLLVAKKLNRRGVGIELNPAYCDLIVNRLRQDVLPLEAAGD